MGRLVSGLVSLRASRHITGGHLASLHLTGLLVGGLDDWLTVLLGDVWIWFGLCVFLLGNCGKLTSSETEVGSW